MDHIGAHTCDMEGYQRLAALMGSLDEFAIFRRFRSLNMQNILYLQAEIMHLEEELLELSKRDVIHPSRTYHHKDWWSLANGEEAADQDQWKKVLEIREKLKVYSKLVCRGTTRKNLTA